MYRKHHPSLQEDVTNGKKGKIIILSPFVNVSVELKRRNGYEYNAIYTNCPPGQRFYRCRYVAGTHPGNHLTRNVGSTLQASIVSSFLWNRTPLVPALVGQHHIVRFRNAQRSLNFCNARTHARAPILRNVDPDRSIGQRQDEK